MPSLVIPPGFGHLALALSNAGNGKTCIITDGFIVDTPPYTQVEANALSTGLRNALQPLYDAEWTIGGLTLLIGNDGPLFRFDATGTSGGTRTAQTTVPPQVSYLLKKTTGFAGRKFRGRAYWPFGGSQAAVDQAGIIQASEITLLTTAATAWATALNNASRGTGGQCILHRDTTAPTPTIDFEPERVVATQRRRLSRRGAV